MAKENTLDLGGLTLIVKDIKQADAPHQEGSATLSFIASDAEVAEVGDQDTATHVLEVTIDGSTYYILLSDDNSTA